MGPIGVRENRLNDQDNEEWGIKENPGKHKDNEDTTPQCRKTSRYKTCDLS